MIIKIQLFQKKSTLPPTDSLLASSWAQGLGFIGGEGSEVRKGSLVPFPPPPPPRGARELARFLGWKSEKSEN